MQNEKKNKNQEASLNMMNDAVSVTLNPTVHQVISTVKKVTVEAKTQSENEPVTKCEEKCSKVPENFKKAKIDEYNPSDVIALKSNLIKSVALSMLKVSRGKEDEQHCNPYESVVPPVSRLSLENYTMVEAQSCSSKVLENIEKETQKNKLTSSFGCSTVQENKPFQKNVKNQLVLNRSQQEIKFNARDSSVTDSIPVNVPCILQKLDNDLVDSTKVTSFTMINTKQQEHSNMQMVNLITQPLNKPLIETKINKPGKRNNPLVSPICKQNDYSYPTVSSIIPSTKEVMELNKPAVKCKILSKSPFISRKRRRKKNCLRNSVAPEPMNNKLVTEEVPLEKRIVITNSGKEPLQETVSLSMERKEHPTTVAISESIPGAQKILSVQKNICSVETQSVQENTSVYKPISVTLNSTNTTDNRDTRTLKVISLTENLSALNPVGTTHDSSTLNKPTELNLNDVKQTNILDINKSNESAPSLLICSNPKQPLYRLELLNSCENSVALSGQQLNHPVQTVATNCQLINTANGSIATNCQLIDTATIPTLYKPILNGYRLYSFPYKSEGISIPIKSGVRYTMIRCNANQIRPREIKIAPKTLNETAVSGNNTNHQYMKPPSSGTNTQLVNNINTLSKNPKKLLGSCIPLAQISSLTSVNSNQIPCPPLLPLAEENKTKISVTKPVQEHPEIKIIDVRTDIANKQNISLIPSSTDDIVQIQPPERESRSISRNTNDLVPIQSPEMEIVGIPKNINNVQMQSSEMDKGVQDSNPSQVQCKTDVESSISELIDQEPRIFQVEVQVPQTMSEITLQQQIPNPRLEQEKVMQAAMKNMSNAIAARQTMKHNKVVSEKRKLMLLEKEAMQKRRIDTLQHVFQVLNHCARMCANEDFEIWFKKEEPPLEQEKNLKDVEGKQEVTHAVTEKPGEWVGLLKVLKVRPINDNEMSKRRRSSKIITRRKQNLKRPEVPFNGSAQKRKSNLNHDATVVDLPETSSKIRKFKRNDSIMDESSSSRVSSKDSSGNFELSTKEVQEVPSMTYHDQKLNEDELEHNGEPLKSDKSNDAQACVIVRQQRKRSGRIKKLETQKMHETPTHVCKKRGRPRKCITESPKKGESEFIFSEDVIVKSESIEIKSDVNNYDICNDETLCQDYGIQECYVRLHRIEDLYPTDYNCIDFDAIFS